MIATERLRLRDWRDDDVPLHNAMANHPEVAAMLGSRPSLADSAEIVARQQALAAEHGHCFWAVERRDDARFVGWCGLQPGKPPIEGELEIGWSLVPDQWGQGLAFEAATACLAWAWANTAAPEVVAITAASNVRSAALMARLGMRRCPAEDFNHPELAPDHPLRAHILCRIGRPHGA